MLKIPDLFKHGHHLDYFPLPKDIKSIVDQEDWPALDQRMQELTAPGGELFNYLSQFHEFTSIEFIISIRDAANEWEEDGIWHDDGSRVFAFSLSLTESPPGGGRLWLRRKDGELHDEIETPPFGGIILFLTGSYGYEHKIHRVTAGRRIIIAGWCS